MDKGTKRTLAVILLLFLMILCGASPSFAGEDVDDLTELSIEDLMQIEVTSVSKKAQKVSDAAAAVFVITQEDIRRSGVTSIPEALRMAPGIEVARINASKWAVSSRGFNSFLANKLLVLMDGRSVYQPLFAGAYWNLQDTMLENIDRIEVIRGPGATLWGANAVNGVINIITKKAEDTRGGLLTAGAGTQERGFGSVRYGLKTGEGTYLRAYGQYCDRGPFKNPAGDDASDAWGSGRGGFRMDSELFPDNTLTIQGDVSQARSDEATDSPILTPPYRQTFSGEDSKTANLLARWRHTFSTTSDLSLQVYYDWMDRRAQDNREKRNTLDIDFQHRFALGSRQEIVWGLGYRHTRGVFSTEPNALIVLDPYAKGDQLFSGFVQDDILVFEDKLHLILGSKFEHNDYTGFEIQPSGRFLWMPHAEHTFWGAVSRGVRTPSWGETYGTIPETVIPPFTAANPSPLPAALSLVGTRDLQAEELAACELGYRFHPVERISLDAAAFYHVYAHMIAGHIGTAEMVLTPTPHMVIPIKGDNGMHGKTYGIELAADWRVVPRWRLQAAYTYLYVALEVDEGSLMALENPDGRSPQNQISLRSAFELMKDVEFDAWVRYADRIKSLDLSGYTTLDLRIGWKPNPNVELSLVGQNLLENEHQEFSQMGAFTAAAKVPRSVYGKVLWKF
ncbi:MAG: TonB-dependent receptor [Deltaproteobacteria bacterium]|nr:TonB-dependent receptor [Deltaproteobacteria bacterium]